MLSDYTWNRISFLSVLLTTAFIDFTTRDNKGENCAELNFINIDGLLAIFDEDTDEASVASLHIRSLCFLCAYLFYMRLRDFI